MIGIKKGYTLTVTSWENDGDNYNTKSKTVATEEEAKIWNDMMQLCKSKNNQKPGVIKLGNSCNFTIGQKELIINFIKQHHKLLIKDRDIDVNDDEELIYYFRDLAGELLGNSEYYACRVMEDCVITYSDIDILTKEIIFK